MVVQCDVVCMSCLCFWCEVYCEKVSCLECKHMSPMDGELVVDGGIVDNYKKKCEKFKPEASVRNDYVGGSC